MKYILITLLLCTFVSASYAASCQSSMIARRGNGRIIQTFFGHGRHMNQACNNAMRQCSQDLTRRHRMGRNPVAVCRTMRNNPRPTPFPPRPPRPPRRITKSCTYNIMENDWNGTWIFDRVTRSVTAQRNAYEKACRVAENDCRRIARYNQWCQQARQGRY